MFVVYFRQTNTTLSTNVETDTLNMSNHRLNCYLLVSFLMKLFIKFKIVLAKCLNVKQSKCYLQQQMVGYSSKRDLNRLDSFIRRAKRGGFLPDEAPSSEKWRHRLTPSFLKH